MDRPATLQIAFAARGADKTSVRVHLEHLPSPEFREEMKLHWKDILDRLAALAEIST